MLKKLIVLAAALACAVPAMADSWNSNKNIESAMGTAIKTYRARGMTGLVDESRNCFAGLDTSARNRNVGRDVEYCIAYELSATTIDREVGKATQFPPTAGLEFLNVMTRAMATLEQAKLVRLPEEFAPYLKPRLQKISDELPRRM